MWRTSIFRPAASPDPPSPAERRPIERILARERLIVLGCLVAVAALSWFWLLGGAAGGGEMAEMAGMAAPEPWSAGYLLPAFLMWALMMVAMMLPSAAPMILLHARFTRRSGEAHVLAQTALFMLAYLDLWLLFSAAATLLQAALVASGAVSAAGLALGGGWPAGGLLALAGLYQLSPLKRACLGQCRSPLGFVMRGWRPGAAGALRLGLAHGTYCLGCCWALMLLLFVGGVMNIGWIGGLALLVLAEKLAPPRWPVRETSGAVLLVAGLVLALGG
ncbi:DUF2182 domain-containing protein [Enterovirga sp. GCM10030262]|uniref:DUF2182 domain-containing protein n=1 Tax=Enterovirga sp. GCM10030262 TaxID=3273391 RepID=UPI00362290F7